MSNFGDDVLDFFERKERENEALEGLDPGVFCCGCGGVLTETERKMAMGDTCIDCINKEKEAP